MKVLFKVLVINVWAGVVITTLFGVYGDVTIDVVFDIDVEVLAGVIANALVAAMTAL